MKKMKNIATPIIKSQANGSFAENEINKYMIATSHNELQYHPQLLKSILSPGLSNPNDFLLK